MALIAAHLSAGVILVAYLSLSLSPSLSLSLSLYIISSLPPFIPSLTNLTASVDVKRHVYIPLPILY